jgi:5-methyltetrahydropteroyltriglutamate--homocysteine methyltransferase
MSIETTLVGSYPVPEWVRAHPGERALEDATRVVMAIQEQAGIDLLTDGELSLMAGRDLHPGRAQSVAS